MATPHSCGAFVNFRPVSKVRDDVLAHGVVGPKKSKLTAEEGLVQNLAARSAGFIRGQCRVNCERVLLPNCASISPGVEIERHEAQLSLDRRERQRLY